MKKLIARGARQSNHYAQIKILMISCLVVFIVSFWEWEKNPRLQAKTSVGLRYYGILS